MAIAAKTKNLEIGKATVTILKSISGGRVLSLTDMYGNGLHLRVIYWLGELSSENKKHNNTIHSSKK